MSVTWEISLGGDRRPLRTWGIRGATLVRRSFAADTLSLEAPGLGATGAVLFPAGETITLWRAGVRYFQGRITSPEVYGSARTQGHTYVASGPWWFLDNLRFQDTRYMFVDPVDPESERVVVTSPRAVLFNRLDGSAMTAGEQWTEMLAFADARGANLTLGTNGLTDAVPFEEVSSVSCAEVGKRCARWSPDAVQWCGYSTAKPTIHVQRRPSLEAVSLDLAAGTRVLELRDIRPMHEARPPGVRFFYEDIVALENGNTRSRYISQAAGNPDLVGGINEVIELGGQGSDAPEPVPADLAARYYAAVSTLNYAGTLVLRDRDVAGDVGVGKVLNLANGRPEWAAMKATIQETSEDIFRGVTTVTFGQPPFLGAAAFVEYLRYARLRSKSNYLTARGSGEGVTSAVSPSSILYNPKAGRVFGFSEIQLCNPKRTIKVWSEITGGNGGPGGA